LVTVLADLPKVATLRFTPRRHGPIVDHQNVDTAQSRQETAEAAISTSHPPGREIAIGRGCREPNTRHGTPSEPGRRPRSFCPRPLVRARTHFRVCRPRLILATSARITSCPGRVRRGSRSLRHKRWCGAWVPSAASRVPDSRASSTADRPADPSVPENSAL